MHLGSFKGSARDSLCTLSSSGGGVYCVSPLPVRWCYASQPAWGIERGSRMSRMCSLGSKRWQGRIFMTSDNWYGEVFKRSPVDLFVGVRGSLQCTVFRGIKHYTQYTLSLICWCSVRSHHKAPEEDFVSYAATLSITNTYTLTWVSHFFLVISGVLFWVGLPCCLG